MSQRERGKFEKLLKKMFWTSQDLTFKKAHLQFSIDRKSISIDRNKQKLTKNFKRNFDWSKNILDQSKIWKNIILEKITRFLKTFLKALNIRNKMHEYEMKCFSKNTSFKPSFPKFKIFKQSPLKFSKHKICFAQQLKVIANLVGQIERHTQ